MSTSVRLHPVAANALKELQERLEREEHVHASERRIVFALIYGATPPQTIGMLNAFTRAELEWKDARRGRTSPPENA
jgi:hypothetical protein